jgi:hypothetical protein
MSLGYAKKTEAQLVWKENKEKITLQARQLMNRMLNEALTELSANFQAGLEKGEILNLDAAKEELRQLLLSAAKRELQAPDETESDEL